MKNIVHLSIRLFHKCHRRLKRIFSRQGSVPTQAPPAEALQSPRPTFVPMQNQTEKGAADGARYRRVFLTFGDSRLADSAARIREQAREMGIFDAIYVTNENHLSPDFFSRFKDRLLFGSRGFGYWCWKPQMVLQALETMEHGDILLYCDIGCHLAPRRRREMASLFERAAKSTFGILAAQMSLAERAWTKGDLFDHYGVRTRRGITKTGQFVATYFWARKSPEVVAFFEEIRAVFETRFDLADDTPSRSPDLPGFREHRHDQSIFSLLAKLHGVDAIPDRSWAESEKEWAGVKFPIQSRRDKKR